MSDESNQPAQSPSTETPSTPEPTPEPSPKPLERPTPMEGDLATKADQGPQEDRG